MEDLDTLILRLRRDARIAVVALTHDPKLDDLALIDALQSDAFYVGVIGSRRNTAQRRERLREHFDLSETALQALHGPAGLYIGSTTPAPRSRCRSWRKWWLLRMAFS